jgi:hypothetical protein
MVLGKFQQNEPHNSSQERHDSSYEPLGKFGLKALDWQTEDMLL